MVTTVFNIIRIIHVLTVMLYISYVKKINLTTIIVINSVHFELTLSISLTSETFHAFNFFSRFSTAFILSSISFLFAWDFSLKALHWTWQVRRDYFSSQLLLPGHLLLLQAYFSEALHFLPCFLNLSRCFFSFLDFLFLLVLFFGSKL